MTNPNLDEITTTTLRNRSKKMPIGPTRTKAQKQQVVKTEMDKFKAGKLHSGSKEGPKVTNPKQAIAISLHEAKIKPKKGYDRSGHHPGNPGFNREGKPPYGDYDAGRQAKQPRGNSIGIHDGPQGHAGQNFQSELKEHWGSKAEGHKMGKRSGVAHTGTEKRGSELIGKGDQSSDHKQPHGKSIGIGEGEQHRMASTGPASHSFQPPPAAHAHGYGHSITQRSGPLRMSGHPGAHQIGRRK